MTDTIIEQKCSISENNIELIEIDFKHFIPNQLRNKIFGFVKLRKKSKIPFERGWQNNPYSYSAIQDWFSKGNNYGVLGGYGDLIIIDADTEEISKLIKDKFPPTFTVKTPKKGYHFYYICKDIKKKIVLNKDDKHHGEIITKGFQAVCPGSIHPDTGTYYLVDENVDIAKITQKQVYSLFQDYISSDLLNETISDKYHTLVKEYGEPYYINKKKEIKSINQAFWASLHKTEYIEIYEPNEKEFYRYGKETGLYKEITEDSIKQEISKRMLDVSRDNYLINGLEQKRTIATLGNIVSQLKGIEEKKNVFTDKKKIIHLKNGILKFKEDNKADLVSFSPDFYSRNASPIVFDENARCERFLKEFLKPTLPDQDIVLLQKYVGMCLLSNNLIQRFLILHGGAARGKSTLVTIIQKLIGMKNVTELRTKHLGERFELFRFRKKTLLTGVDVPGNFLSTKGAYVIKGLVGADYFDAEQKCGTGNFQIKGNFNIIITSNTGLQIKLDDDLGAWRRRLLIIEFEAPKPEKKIPDFADKLLEEESSGILNWALVGLTELFKDIEKYGDIYLTDEQKNIVEGLLDESDSLRHFLQNKVINKENEDLSSTEIIDAYAEYCVFQGWNPKNIKVIQKELPTLMPEMFGTSKAHSLKREGKNINGFRRVAFKD